MLLKNIRKDAINLRLARVAPAQALREFSSEGNCDRFLNKRVKREN
ncbi:hypothetical protein [Laspinema olomoucense]|uniref:Uncharacterized protein n=1 Tax=Laspinema olomoucense D3b TaxID=2953688 RepID=A0ABT2NA11_9CYAN|nr:MULTISPECIES: hypothetical protein [unclassified Laspinema]MCT7976083.1 hypothetical protein [Laspinema sp. D3d]MCT7979533.1 hypothetical protein [Laspinema sp. D3b]MCT7997404.1 hypothetical protein [Laspinema sp. D3c]